MSTNANLEKVIIFDVENGIETKFDIGLWQNNLFIPRNNRSKKMVCTMIFSDSSSREMDFNSVEDLDDYFHSEAKRMCVCDDIIDKWPQLSYCDVTEKILLSSKEISDGILSSEENGILACFGKRKLCVSFERNFDKVSVKSAELRILKVNGEDIDERLFIESSNSVMNGTEFIFDVDTDELGKLFEKQKFKKFENLRLSCGVRILANVEEFNNEVEFLYPLDISLVNTNPEVFRNESRHSASIDFGTTSTCVAIYTSNGNELLTISPSENSESYNSSNYENPTNLMVFDWDNIYENWIKECDTVIPTFYKGGKQENTQWKNKQSDSPVHFDFGYKVKDELGAELTNRETINSIMTLLKMIPYKILHDKRQVQFNPYNNSEKFVYLVTSPEEQDEEHFDPIAFYGYLIGRMINDRSKRNIIHTSFLVTSPVKFNDEVKDSIKKSLQYGLKRTVPKPLQGKVKVEMKYCEPVAFIGAICGPKYLTLDEGETVKFAVYDFGGGTLDFSFGEVRIDEDDYTNVDVRMTGGDETIGGESIIERLTFMIYKHNIAQMQSKKIPIEKPVTDQIPDNFDEQLLAPTQYSIANTNIISYRISRKIFEGKNVEQKYDLDLYDLTGEQVKVEINCPKDELDSFVEKTIRDSVKLFSGEMKTAFSDLSDEDFKKIRIYLAGNSSRNKHVKPEMKKEFPDALIERPDETESIEEEISSVDAATVSKTPKRKTRSVAVSQEMPSVESKIIVETSSNFETPELPEPVAEPGVKYTASSNVNRRYAITPKTAVALGQLNLHDMIINDRTKDSFMMNIGYEKKGQGIIKTILEKGRKSTEWVKFRKLSEDGTVSLYYSESNMDARKSYPYYSVDDGEPGKVLYVRVKDKYAIEYCFGEADNVIPDDAKIFTIDFSELLTRRD